MRTLPSMTLFAVLCALATSSAAQDLIISNGAAWNTCTGVFYDSGGPSGDYGSNQNFTATLCPAGGAGSGASTVIRFNVFDVGSSLDTGDELIIHDGTNTGGTILGTGNFSNGLAGQTFTAAGPSGCLTFHWTSTLLGTGTGWVAQVLTGPDAGTSTTLTLCSDQPSFPLIDALNGNPDIGGSWTGPNGPHAAQFDPSTDPSGIYHYTVIDGSLCVDSSAVTINNVAAPDPGEDAVLNICDVSPPVQLINSLGGSPAAGGIWTGPGGASDGTFDPATDPPGDYAYTVVGTSPCNDGTAILTVILTGQPDAGINGSITVCDTVSALALFPALGGTPDLGGTWEPLDADTLIDAGLLSTIGLTTGAHHFRYIAVVAGCGTDTSDVTVHVLDGVDVSNVRRVCDEESGTSYITLLIIGGDADSYSVTGVPGTIESTGYFTSAVLADSLQYTLVISDANACNAIQLELVSCSYVPHVEIPQIFSPNGDAVNETFHIPGLEDFPGNEIFIYNRWGNEVYHASNYHEANMAWNGAYQNGSVFEVLPAGTYFYVLDLGSGDPLKGYVYLNR